VSVSDLLTPIIGEVGIGGIGGFVVGYALKKLAKLVVLILGMGFVLLEYLAYLGIISINFTALQNWAEGLIAPAGALGGFLVQFLANLPFGASFGLGFYVGLKKG
jgi:uncharacterized membrane protein (Fun14 family)